MLKFQTTNIIFILALMLTISGWSQNMQVFVEQPVFENGQDGYQCFRIPAIIKAGNGDLLAFAEGRTGGCNDFGNLDIVLKTSQDNGHTWGALKIVADNGILQSGNPAPVLDRFNPKHPDGKIFLIYNNGIASEHDTRQGEGMRNILYITSTDHGKTWSAPIDITNQVHKPRRPDIDQSYNHPEDWRSYALTPGHALQLEKGKYKGRIFIPANHSEGAPQTGFNDYRAHAFYSDDHGQSWQLSPSIDHPSSNESIAVELSDGSVMQNIRQQNGEQRERLVAISKDGGESWTKTYYDSALVAPVCQASIISHTLENGQEVILFSNPESKTKREKLTIKMSFDDGVSWPVKRMIRSGGSAYSDLVIQENEHIGLLYEHGNNGGIHYTSFNLSWLIGDQDYKKNKPWVNKFLSPKMTQGQDIQLSKPIARYNSSLFANVAKVQFELDYPGSDIYYTLDGSTPNDQSIKYEDHIDITASATLSAIAVHPDVKSSDAVRLTFIKAVKTNGISFVKLSREPSEKYKGGGAYSLFDLKKGQSNFSTPEWMGYEGGDVSIDVDFDKPRNINNIKVNTLTDHGSWIFAPERILVSINGQNFTKDIGVPGKAQSIKQQFLEIPISNIKTDKITITIKAVNSLPDWHQGKGGAAWMFIDEILID